MTEKLEVLDFIARRWSDTDAHWFDGNCYWFAHILCARFPFLEIYYCPISGHFVAGVKGEFYDASGLFVPDSTEKVYLLEDIKRNDDLWYSHIMRDCRD
jgi:hypothetical protein